MSRRGAARRRWGAAVGGLAAAALLIAPSSAAAAVSFEVIPPARGPTYPGNSVIGYALRATTQGQEERFSVSLRLPVFEAPGIPPEGPSIGQIGIPTLSGAGELRVAGAAIPQYPACTGHPPFLHFVDGDGYFVDVRVPADSTATLLYQFRADIPPWLDVSLAPTFVVGNPSAISPFAPGTLPAALSLKGREPQVTGQTGLLIRFKTKPASAPWAGSAPTQIHRGRPIRIRGSTFPIADRQVVRLLVGRPGAQNSQGRMKTLAKVRTNRRGRFFHKGWKPKRLGPYAVAVTYKSQRRNLASDFTCSRLFELVK